MSRKRPKEKRHSAPELKLGPKLGPTRIAATPVPRGESWKGLTAVFVIALVVRLVHIWQIRDTPFFDVLMGDAKAYDEWAQRIAAGDWIGRDVFYQAPLYPYFLGTIYAVAGRSLLFIRVCQAILGSLACVLLALAGRRLFTPRTGLIAGLALALYAPAIFFDGLLQKTVLDEFFICLMLWITAEIIDRTHDANLQRPGNADLHRSRRADLHRSRSADLQVRGRERRWWLALGLVTGGLSLTRENALVFVVVIAAWAMVEPWARGRYAGSTLKQAAFWRTAPFLFGLAIVLLPVAIRNYAVGGGFYLTTSQFGPNFYMGNNEKADGTAMSLRRGRGSPEYERQDAIDLAERALGRKLTPAEVSSYWTEQSLAFMTSHPMAWMKLQARKAALLWNATEILDTESQESYAEWSAPLRIGGIFGHFGVLVPLALFGLLLSWNDRRRLWPVLAMIAAYAASVVMFYIYARYRYPLVPMLLLFAAAGITKLPGFVRSVRAGSADGEGFDASSKTAAMSARGRVLVTLTVLLAVVFTNWSMVSADMNRTVTEHNLGAALQDRGRLDEAIAAYRRALVISPDYAPAYGNIGTAQQAKGQIDEAIASYERALQISPDFPEIHYNLANALLAKQQPDQAAEHFRVAAQALPGAADVHNNLGSALIEQGKFEEAVSEFQKAAQFDPKSAKVQRNLGNALASAGRPIEGLEHLLEATRLDPRDTSAHYDFGSLLLEGERLPEAIQEFRTAIALKPDMVSAHNNLGIALGLSGQVEASIAAFKEALRLDPSFEDARRNLAMTLEARDQVLKKR